MNQMLYSSLIVSPDDTFINPIAFNIPVDVSDRVEYCNSLQWMKDNDMVDKCIAALGLQITPSSSMLEFFLLKAESIVEILLFISLATNMEELTSFQLKYNTSIHHLIVIVVQDVNREQQIVQLEYLQEKSAKIYRDAVGKMETLSNVTKVFNIPLHGGDSFIIRLEEAVADENAFSIFKTYNKNTYQGLSLWSVYFKFWYAEKFISLFATSLNRLRASHPPLYQKLPLLVAVDASIGSPLLLEWKIHMVANTDGKK